MRDWKSVEDSALVCYCISVNKKSIVGAIQNGSKSLAEIKENTRACTGNDCKRMNPSGTCCSADINELIRIYG